TTPCVRPTLTDGSLIWPKPAGAERGPGPVTPVGRQRSGGGPGAECTAGQKAQAGLGVIATAISNTGFGAARAWQPAGPGEQRFGRSGDSFKRSARVSQGVNEPHRAAPTVPPPAHAAEEAVTLNAVQRARPPAPGIRAPTHPGQRKKNDKRPYASEDSGAVA